MSPLFVELGPVAAVAVFLFGLVAGSFLNVVIHRFPRGESVVFPGSHCPACGAPIRVIDNVPVLSWVLLRGRCRDCRARISPRYPLVELVNAALWLAVFLRAPGWPDFASGAFLCSACIALLAIDAEFRILPDRITLTGIAVGLALSFLSQWRTPTSAFGGAALGAGALWLLAFVWEKVRKVEAMGLGDVKMLGMIGALLGISGMVLSVLLASVAGSLVGLALVVARRGSLQTALPFGVFLALGAIASLFWGPEIVALYRAGLR
jgi:leader peptidase (prepilin peptidase) / N-methyltransferase